MAKGKKQEDPNKVAQRKAERVAFVQNNPQLAPEVARQRFYVQTRANELEAAGKDVDRAALRAKFQSGGVTREGFYTPGDISRFSASRNTDSLGDAKNTPTVTPTPPVSPVAPSATNVPTPVKPKTNTTTSGAKTPPSSYQAPQVTTSLGQVVTPPTSYQAPRKSTPVRGGEPGRTAGPSTKGTPARGGEPRTPVFNQSGLTFTPATTNPAEGREFTSTVGRINPQAPANPAALRQQQQARWERVEVPKIKAEMNRNNPLRAAQQAKIDAGFVEAPYDWTNLYKVTAGSLTLAAEIAGTRFGGPVGGALATGATFNVTERLGNLLEQKGALGGTPGDPGRFEGKTDLKSAAIVGGASLAGNLVGTGAQKLIPKIKPAWQAVQRWADDTPAMPVTPWKEGGASSPGIATGITPRTPWREGPITSGTKSPRRVNTPKPTAETPTPTRVDLPGETQTSSGIIIPAPTRRTPAAERNPVLQDALDKVVGKGSPTGGRTAAEKETLAIIGDNNYNAIDEAFGRKAAQEPASLADTKANTVAEQLKEDGVAELTPRQVAARKGAATRKANREKALEIKKPEPTPEPTDLGDEFGVVRFGPSTMSEPIPVSGPRVVDPTDPEYAKLFDDKGERIFLKYENKPVQMLDEVVEKPELGVVQGEAPDRLEQMRRHPAFTSKLPEEKPTLSVVGDEPVRAATKTPPRQRPNETAEAYGRRLEKWQQENTGAVFKAPAGFEQPRGTTSFREGAMNRIQGGMSRTRRSVAYIDDGSGMSPEGFPVQKEGESIMAFNVRASEFLKSRGKVAPQAPDNSFLAQGTPEPVSLAGSKEALAATPTGEIPPKPKGLGRNAFYDAEKGEWVKGVLDKKSGKIVAQGERTVYATEEERIAGKKAYEAQRNADRRAKRAANRAAKETELKAAATPVNSNAEYGPFMFGGEPVGRSRVMLEPGQVPDWAQQNISLTGEAKPLSAVEDAWLNKELTPEENAFFRELGNAKKTSAGKRVVRSTRQATPEEVKEYVARFRGLRAERTETGLSPGSTSVALTDTQIQLEKEIEQVLGTDAMIALRNTAIRGNTPPLTQNVRGLESLAEVKAASGEPLINKVVVRQATPTSSGKLREQAANFFNAEGRLKGVSGADRIRTWNRLTKSDWFRQLQEREPSFANFLREQNSDIAGKFDPMLSRQVEQLPKPGFRRTRPMRGMGIEEEEKFISGQLANEQTDDGLGAYKLSYGETPQDGLRARDSGTTVSQRSQAAQIEASLMRRERLLRQIKAEDQAAFGDIEYLNRGFERGQQLDPMVDPNVTKDYGIVDEKGFTNINAAEFRSARRQLNSPEAVIGDSRTEEVGAAIEAQRQEVVARWKAKEITKEQMNAELLEYRTPLYDAPSTGLPANPFAQEFGTQLPKDYVQETPESFGKVWDPDTFTNELGTKVNGRWVTRQEAAEKAQSRIDKQAVRTAKMELERENFYSTRWLDVAKRRAIAARSVKPEQTPMFDKFGPVRSEASIREEAQRLASLERKAAKARAAAPRGKTAEEIRFELKNPMFGPEAPAGSRSSWGSDAASLREEEARISREMMSDFEQFDMDLSDIFGPEDIGD